MTGYLAMRGSLDPDPDSVGMTIKSPRSRLNSLAKIVTHMRKHLAASGINNDPAAASAIRETRDLHSLLPSLHAGGDTFDCSMGRWFHEVLPSHYKQCHQGMEPACAWPQPISPYRDFHPFVICALNGPVSQLNMAKFGLVGPTLSRFVAGGMGVSDSECPRADAALTARLGLEISQLNMDLGTVKRLQSNSKRSFRGCWIDHGANFRDGIRRESSHFCMLPNGVLVWGDVHTVDLIVGHVALNPLHRRPQLSQDAT
jgi:hypothetical protein